jgi:hypothetical protein
MNDALDNAIAALEGYLRRYPDGNFSEIAQLRLDQLLAKRGETKVAIVAERGNPFSKGTVAARTDYSVGDSYEYRVTDLYTRIERTQVKVVTAVSELEVVYNDGRLVTDPLGNRRVATSDGARFTEHQVFPAEYAIGRKWSTRFRAARAIHSYYDIEYAVVARENIAVPAGTFDAFKIKGTGWVSAASNTRLDYTYWVAPDKVRLCIAFETRVTSSPLRPSSISSERMELVRFSENT